MKAIIFNKKAAHKLTLQEVEKPKPLAGQVLVRIHAVSINAADYRSMRYGILPKSGIYGADIAGVVEIAGEGADDFKPGDRVFGDILDWGWGGLAEYVAVSQAALISIPEGVSFADAAALPIAALTALQALRDLGGVKAGQKVLVYGAGGGVGTFAVQLARHFGAEVSAVCGPRNVEKVRSLGASRVFDYSSQDFSADPDRYDLILAVNGSRPLADYLHSLNQNGFLIVIGGSLSQIIPTMLFGPFLSLGGKKTRLVSAKPNRADLACLAGFVRDGSLKPVIDRVFPLAEAPQALDYLAQGHAGGKVIIQDVP